MDRFEFYKSDLTPTAKVLALYLEMMCSKTKKFNIDNKSLSRYINCSINSLKSSRDELVKVGLLKYNQNYKDNTKKCISTDYYFKGFTKKNVSKIDTLTDADVSKIDTPNVSKIDISKIDTPLKIDNNKDSLNKENNCSINSTVVKESAELKREVEILEEEHSYFDEDDKRLFDMRQAFKHINSDDSWVDRYFNTLNKIDGVKLTTPMRVLIGGQIDTLYDDRPNDNFETDFKVLRNRLQTPNYYQMKTNITQADRETAL